jgi:hypothetical protein
MEFNRVINPLKEPSLKLIDALREKVSLAFKDRKAVLRTPSASES